MCLSRRLRASISCDPQVPISIQLWSKCCVPFRWHILVKDASVVCASLACGLQNQYNRYLIPVYFKRDHHLSYTYMSVWEMKHRCRAKNGRGKNSTLQIFSYPTIFNFNRRLECGKLSKFCQTTQYSPARTAAGHTASQNHKLSFKQRKSAMDCS